MKFEKLSKLNVQLPDLEYLACEDVKLLENVTTLCGAANCLVGHQAISCETFNRFGTGQFSVYTDAALVMVELFVVNSSDVDNQHTGPCALLTAGSRGIDGPLIGILFAW